MMEDFVKARVERANLRWSVDNLVLKVRETSVDLGGALQTVVESSNCLFNDFADKVTAEIGYAWKRMLSSFNMKYASAVSTIRANVDLDNDELFVGVSRCTALISTRFNKIDGSLPVKGKSATGNIGSIRLVEPSGQAAIDCDGPTLEYVYTCF